MSVTNATCALLDVTLGTADGACGRCGAAASPAKHPLSGIVAQRCLAVPTHAAPFRNFAATRLCSIGVGIGSGDAEAPVNFAKAGVLPGPARLPAERLLPPRPDGGGDPAPRGSRPFRGRRERRAALGRFALLVPLLAFAPPAPISSAEGDAAPAGREQIPLGATVRLVGRDVKGPSGEVVAQIINVLVDEAGRPVAAVLDYGGFMGVGRRRIAVAWRALRFALDGTPDGAVTLGLTRDQLKDFPEAKRGEPAVAAAPAAVPAAPTR